LIRPTGQKTNGDIIKWQQEAGNIQPTCNNEETLEIGRRMWQNNEKRQMAMKGKWNISKQYEP